MHSTRTVAARSSRSGLGWLRHSGWGFTCGIFFAVGGFAATLVAELPAVADPCVPQAGVQDDAASDDLPTTDFRAQVTASNGRVRVLNDDGRTVFDIQSRQGIGRASLRRESREWPKSIRVRLHLRGLESFTVRRGDLSVQWWVAGGSERKTYAALRQGRQETALDAKSPYYTPVRVVGKTDQVPLRDGYFEVVLPAKLLAGNPPEIKLSWVDFYRD